MVAGRLVLLLVLEEMELLVLDMAQAVVVAGQLLVAAMVETVALEQMGLL